jgi:tRNA pseudouridine38-40 synthase
MGTESVSPPNKNYVTPHPDPLPLRGEGISNDLITKRGQPTADNTVPILSLNQKPAADKDSPEDTSTSGKDTSPTLPQDLRTIRLTLEYDGSGYHGWQRQQNALTIQEVVETSLARLVGREVRLHGSGRTDAGVHALGQVAHFRTESKLPLAAFREGLNSLLPRDIAILQAEEAPAGFHARYDAKAKTYEYRILHRMVRSPLHRQRCWHLGLPLDLDRIRQGTRLIIGEHDFAGFQNSGSAIRTTRRRVLTAAWEEKPENWLCFRITASGFLRGMVRALVGTLVEVGRGKRQPEDMGQLLAAADRRLAGPAAPAAGLYLVEVVY